MFKKGPENRLIAEATEHGREAAMHVLTIQESKPYKDASDVGIPFQEFIKDRVMNREILDQYLDLYAQQVRAAGMRAMSIKTQQELFKQLRVYAATQQHGWIFELSEDFSDPEGIVEAIPPVFINDFAFEYSN